VVSARLSLRGTQLYLTKTTEQGTFSFPRTAAGKYSLAIDQAGFCKLEVGNIAIASGEKKVLPRLLLKVPADGQECPSE